MMDKIKKTNAILTVVAVLLAVLAAAVWLMPPATGTASMMYGTSEGLQLVRRADGSLAVKDSAGNTAFAIPLRGCVIDSVFRGGKLMFREKATGRKGYIDRQGFVNFINDNSTALYAQGNDADAKANFKTGSGTQKDEGSNYGKEVPLPRSHNAGREQHIGTTDLRSMARSNPFYGEAAKILHGKLNESDARRRRVILNYCEHFRTAYTTKDIDFLRQVFSDKALIIVGNVVRNAPANADIQEGVGAGSRVTYALHTKADYLARLERVFKANKHIDVRFTDFRIMRHPTRDGIYGVTLRQRYKSDKYEDDGWLFLLWDFSNPSMPLIHVRTWQPEKTVGNKDDVIGISDFNLE